jgi:hypothetical protein
MKKGLFLLFTLVVLATTASKLDLGILIAKAQVHLWEYYCPGAVETVPQGSGYLVSCHEPVQTPTPNAPTATPRPPSGAIVVDHTSVARFEQIPAQYLTAARNLEVLFSDRSVGNNFHLGLDCLKAASFGAAPAYCRRDYNAGSMKTYNQADKDAGRVPVAINFTPSATLYDRSNWAFEFRGGSWSELTCDFINSLAPANLNRDVLSYQFSYLNVDTGSDIMRFFENTSDSCDVYDLEAFIAAHPDKTFIFWTASLARGIGTREAADFNDRMRQYARDQGKILFDFAAIESHTPSGQPCYDNRDGVAFTSPTNGGFENYPNDGVQSPSICQDYTTEVDGGHLGSVSGGMIRTAKAFWVLMAQIAGWRP